MHNYIILPVFCMGVKLGLWHWRKNIGCERLRIRCWGEYFGLRGRGDRGVEKTTNQGALWSVLLTQYCAGDQIENIEMEGACSTYGGRVEVHTGFWWENLRERDHLGDPGVDGRIILKGSFKDWLRQAWTGLIWLRIWTGVGHLWMW